MHAQLTCSGSTLKGRLGFLIRNALLRLREMSKQEGGSEGRRHTRRTPQVVPEAPAAARFLGASWGPCVSCASCASVAVPSIAAHAGIALAHRQSRAQGMTCYFDICRRGARRWPIRSAAAPRGRQRFRRL